MSDPLAPQQNPTVAPPATESRPQYEFDAAQNEVINALVLGMMWVRVPLFVGGLLQVAIAIGLTFRIPKDGAHIIGVLGHGMAAIVCFLLAAWLLRAAEAFAKVTTTTGRDISHLMTGLRSLAMWFDTLGFFVKLYLILLAVLLLILTIGLFTGTFRGAA